MISRWFVEDQGAINVRFIKFNIQNLIQIGDHRGPGHMVVGFTTTFAISTYHHYSCEFKPCSWQGVLDRTFCNKVCQ